MQLRTAPLRPSALFSIQDHNQYPLALNGLSMAEMEKKNTLFLIHPSRPPEEGILIRW